MSQSEVGRKESGAPRAALLDILALTPYDELIEFDMVNNRQHNLAHVEGKYFVPVMESTMSAMYRFALENMIHPDDRSIQREFLNLDTMAERLQSAPSRGLLQAEVRYRLLDGEWNWTREILVSGEDKGLPAGIARLYIYDIQAEKEAARPASRHGNLLRRDERTGLLTDRDLFPLAKARMRSLTGRWCVISIDIEHFQLFTDWHGKEAADLLLARIGEILQREAEAKDGLAGYHGLDDFWLMIPYDAERIDALYEELRQLIVSHGNSVGFLPIFGICMIDGADVEITDIFNHASMTAEQVKGDLHERIRVYDPVAYDRTVEEYHLIADFERGLKNREIFFCLQPQCRVSTGRVVGAESLARWRLPDGTMVPPAKFVPILEKYGMVTNLDQYIWDGVCAWLRRWIDAGHTPVPVSVNISQIDILTIDVPDALNRLLEKYGLPSNLLKAEITESAYAADTEVVTETVRRLKRMGLLVMMDDFGSGYSSLNMLRSLNIDIIKLDAQFLRISVQDERKGISILESVVNMAKTLSLPIIVEGVETYEQINFLSDLGCRYIQGYYFHRPMPVADFEALIADPANIDLSGFEFKATAQIHPREFLDENVFSDAMLNNILGPVAIYLWDGDNVDITRYNQQFYQMAGIPVEQLNERLLGMQEYLYPEDKDKLYRLLEAAALDHLNGSRGVLRVYKPNGSLRWISVQLYYLSEDDPGMSFYAACEDITELQYFNVDVPGGYHRCLADGSFEFAYISQNFQDMTGYSAQEIRDDFDNRLINMVHPDDVRILLKRADAVREGRQQGNVPYRLKRREGGYIYVQVQSIMTDLYGEVCFMSVATDVTELVKLKNNMQLLARFSTDSIALLRKKKSGWKYNVIVHGMEDRLGLKKSAFEDALNSGAFYTWIDEPKRSEIAQITMDSVARQKPFDFIFTLNLPGGGKQRVHMKTDHVDDAHTKVEYIVVFRSMD